MSLCVVKGLVFYPVFEHVCPVVVLHVVRSDVLRLAAALQSQLSAVLVWVSGGERDSAPCFHSDSDVFDCLDSRCCLLCDRVRGLDWFEAGSAACL